VSVSQGRTKLIRRLADRKTRARESRILVEGVRCAEEALAAKLVVSFAVVASSLERSERGERLALALQGSGVEVKHVEEVELATLANTEHPQGVLLVCEEPRAWEPSDDNETLSPILLADGIQDPGNFGTLARTAAAFGFAGVVALDGTVDPWNPKCVRAAAGGLFHIGVKSDAWANVGPWLKAHKVNVLAGTGGGADVASVSPGPRWALVIGNEGVGVRQDILDAGAEAVSVAMKGTSESLNAAVAGGILMYTLVGGTP
jgi:RNA methyltransferase, TrmH family